MAAPGSDKALVGIMQWSVKDEWSDAFEATFDAHLGPVLEEAKLTSEQVSAALGEAYSQLLGCVFEDFLTCRFGPEDRNVVEDYLERRGWKEPEPVRQYLEALQRSVMSVYEVTETTPGSHFMAQDLIRGGDPIRVEDRLASANLERSDHIAGRLLPIGEHTYLAGGVLPLSFEDARELTELFRQLKEKCRQEVEESAEKGGVDPPGPEDASLLDEILLGELAYVFTQTWFIAALNEAFGGSDAAR